MHKILTVLVALSALLPASGRKEIVKPPLAPPPPAIEQPELPNGVLPRDGRTDDTIRMPVSPRDTRTSPQEDAATTAYDRYIARKQALDARYAHMFALDAEIDRAQNELDAKREECYALHDKYNRELRKLVSLWATEEGYAGSAERQDERAEDDAQSDGDYEIARPMPHLYK